MGKKLYDNFLTVVLGVLIACIIATAGYLIYKYYEKIKLNNDAANVLREFDEELEKRKRNTEPEEVVEPTPTPEEGGEGTGGTGYSGMRGIDNGYEVKYRSYTVAGKLEMPTIGLQYPVLSQMTDANAIEVSVAIQYGVGLNKPGNTVIIGHNYRSGLFFGSNKNLQVGQSIFITDWETGQRIEYEIYNKYTTEEADTSFYQRNTNGKREVSLVTCQTNNAYRLVILAREID